MHSRFIGENLEKNKLLYKRPNDLASKHACTPSQLALVWLLQQGNDIIPIPVRAVLENLPSQSMLLCSLLQVATLRVQSMAGEEQKEQPREPANTVTPPAQPQPNPTCSPKMSTKFTDLMAFGGPAPERINGKLAMIGFVGAMGVEIANGQGVFEQISSGGISLFLGTSLLLSVASLVPLFQGVSVESKSKGLFSSDAELWNGRFAMLGLIALAFTEYVKGSTLV